METNKKNISSKLGVREVSDGVGMMAGYWSEFIHSKVFEEMVAVMPDKNARILDIGAGHGGFCKRLQNSGYSDLHAIEGYSSFDLEGVQLFRNDLDKDWNLSLEKKSVDVAIAIEIIEHIEGPYHFLREIRKYLKNDGFLLVSTPNTVQFMDRIKFLKSGKLGLMKHEDHRMPIFPETMERMCEEVGFKIKKISYDVDFLRIPSSTLKGKLGKPFMRFIRSLIVKDVERSKGNTSIWVLTPVDDDLIPIKSGNDQMRKVNQLAI